MVFKLSEDPGNLARCLQSLKSQHVQLRSYHRANHCWRLVETNDEWHLHPNARKVDYQCHGQGKPIAQSCLNRWIQTIAVTLAGSFPPPACRVNDRRSSLQRVESGAYGYDRYWKRGALGFYGLNDGRRRKNNTIVIFVKRATAKFFCAVERFYLNVRDLITDANPLSALNLLVLEMHRHTVHLFRISVCWSVVSASVAEDAISKGSRLAAILTRGKILPFNLRFRVRRNWQGSLQPPPAKA